MKMFVGEPHRNTLLLYGQIPTVFEVRSRLAVELIAGGMGGLSLRAVDRFAYTEEPEVVQEIMMLWQKTNG